MSTLVDDCPRCGAKEHTFDVSAHVPTGFGHADWMEHDEVFATCRRCRQPTIFQIELFKYEARNLLGDAKFWSSDINLNAYFRVLGHVGLRHNVARKSPEYVPPLVQAAFEEGAVCLEVGCFNAAATMFRLCLDLATRDLLPANEGEDGSSPEGGPTRRERRDLGLRIPWLIANGRLPADLRNLADVIREDANDGAHAGTLTKIEAEDIADFTEVLLDRLYTEAGKIAAATLRREDRRR